MQPKLLFFFIFGLLSFSIQKVNAQVLSVDFKSFLISRYPACYNSTTDQLDLACDEIVNEDSLFILNERIDDLNGIEAFVNLVYLDISQTGDMYGNNITVPTLPPALKTYRCRNMGGYTPESYNVSLFPPVLPLYLERIDAANSRLGDFNSVLPATLKYINVSGCSRLTGLPALPSGLDTLMSANIRYEYYNGSEWIYTGLTSLPALPSGLKYLDCSNGRLSSLPALPASLTYLNCSGNKVSDPVSGITTLPALPSGLVFLACNSNRISELPALPTTLTYLDFGVNSISQPLTALPEELTFLRFSQNQVPSVQSFPRKIKELRIDFNPLQSLPALPDSLEVLICNNNSNLTSLPPLPSKLRTLSCATTPLNCCPISPNLWDRLPFLAFQT